ncbi:MAG: hypothetical protein M0P57_08985 [Syntrophales bacterium]|jgi:hypothetical protein|nr:hypothetical protein [Syntrophales bacterium]MDY0044907.1 hypothetical protein [Syntrophales bacterium]
METLVHEFTAYVSGMAGQAVVWGDPVPVELPQYLAQRYVLREIIIGRRRFVGIVLIENVDFRPALFEKHLRQIMTRIPNLEVYCLIVRDLPGYVRRRLIERKIPFVVPGRQLYWPDLGLAVQAKKAKRAPLPVRVLSPSTQAVLIYALKGGMIDTATPKILSQKLRYTTMSMSRAIDEIEANKLGLVTRRGRERLLSFMEGTRTLWDKAKPFMQTPVRTKVRVRESLLAPELRIEAGETALAGLSMLAFPEEPVYAMGRRAWKGIADKIEIIPVQDDGTCLVELWRYDPVLFSKEGKVDVFSLYLSLREDDDERIEAALEEMMEKIEWS